MTTNEKPLLKIGISNNFLLLVIQWVWFALNLENIQKVLSIRF